MDNKIDHWPIVIIGGGIVGAGIYRDLSLHKEKVLLIEQGHFSSQTSGSSSKMLHGGIRYLENFDIALVKEALREKNLWLKLAPDLSYRQEFAIPIFDTSKRPLWMVAIGIWLYQLLSDYKFNFNSFLNAKKTAEKFPEIKTQGLSGCGIYSDAIVDDKKLTIKVIEDASLRSNSKAQENLSLEEFSKLENGQYQLKLYQSNEQKYFHIICDQLIFATGPFTDKLMKKLGQIPWGPKLLLSKGSHLWLKSNCLTLPKPIVLTPRDGRIIFVIPYPDRILVGTTEQEITSAEFDINPTQGEVDYLLDNIKEFFPLSTLSKEDIIGQYAGIRPLVRDDNSSHPGDTTREHQIYQPDSNIYVIIGGKYTTFRVMASDVAQLVIRKRKKPYRADLSLTPLKTIRKPN